MAESIPINDTGHESALLSERTSANNSQQLDENGEEIIDVKRITIDQAFKKIGGFGRFQLASCIVNTVVNAATMLLFNSISFLETEPQFMCQLNPPSPVYTYTNHTDLLVDQYCSGEYNCQINWDSRLSIDNILY